MTPPRSSAPADGASSPAIEPAVRRRALHVPKAPEIVASRIRTRIVAGGLKAGEFLPPEARLMEEFGVSRPTIREAFRILESERLISIARGARGGAIVHAPDPELICAYSLLVMQSERTTVDELFSSRRLIEPAVAREVALIASASAPPILLARLEEERAAVGDPAQLATALARFHRALVALSGNRPLIHLVDTITSVIETHQAMVIARVRRTQRSEEILAALEVGFKSHRKLIDLIGKGDGAGAEAHWRKHMEASHKTWIAGYETLTIHELVAE